MATNRQVLQANTSLEFCDNTYYIQEVVGFGGSCIVYDGYYLDNMGNHKKVRIKECYPDNLSIIRGIRGELLIDESKQVRFAEARQRLRCAYQVMNNLYNTTNLTNTTSNSLNLYEFNNTIYVVSTFNRGNTLADVTLNTLKEVVTTVLSVAKCVGAMHQLGYLYLDIKPENVLVFEETKELVMLFDFDSVIAIDKLLRPDDWTVGFTQGFSALEQRVGAADNIGTWSDVYGVGALLYYLVIGERPTAMQGEYGYKFDCSASKWGDEYPDKMFYELEHFFENTLCSYHKDRYQTMDEVRNHLERILKYADLSKAFARGVAIPEVELCLGRECELEALTELVNASSGCVLVSGMGGVGKSTLVRQWLANNKAAYDGYVYLYYRDELISTICDDRYCIVSNCEKLVEENASEYYERKIKAISDISKKSKLVIVIDNYDGNLDESFRMLISCGATVIAITRADLTRSGYQQLLIEPIKDKATLYELIKSNLNREIAKLEIPHIDSIISYVGGHTLSLELISKQVASNNLSFETAAKLIADNGITDLGNSKLELFRDGSRGYNSFQKLVAAIFDNSALSMHEIGILKLVALFDSPGVSIECLSDSIKESVDEALDKLRNGGWLSVNADNVDMHPLIQEAVFAWRWSTTSISYALAMLRTVKAKSSLSYAMSLIKYGWRTDCLVYSEELKQLTMSTIMTLPKDCDDYIIQYAYKIFETSDSAYLYELIELYDYCIYLECQRKMLNNARALIKKAKALAKKSKDNYACAVFCDALMDYYETMLDGAYDYGNEEEQKYYDKLLKASDSAINYISKSKQTKADELHAKYLLGKACLLIRNYGKEYDEEIRRLVMRAKVLIELEEPLTQNRATYCAAMAWYYTLAMYDSTKVDQWLERLKEIEVNRELSDLDLIDYYYIPAANMQLELENNDRSKQLLLEAIEICKAHPEIAPYIRKMQDLHSYLLDV